MAKIKFTAENMMVFRKDFDNGTGYSTSIGIKKKDGTWDNVPIRIGFKQGIEVSNKSKINVSEGELTAYKKADGTVVFTLRVYEFDGDSEVPEGFAVLDDDSDLPF